MIYKDFPDKVIVNAGISGAGLYDELNYFKDKGKKLSPKVVFLQIGAFNDFMNIREHQPSLQDYIMEWSALYRYFEYNIANSDELPLGRWTEPFFPNKEDNIDNNIFFNFMYRVREAGITVPIIPGIMPITRGVQVKNAVKLSGCNVPERFKNIVDRFGDNPEAMKQAGIAYATDQIIDLLANGVKHIHVYSMNKPDVAAGIQRNLSEILKA